jgi:Xaa-Pro aminopeptidase
VKRCICTGHFNPACPFDHDAAAESLAAAVAERIAAKPYSELREACADFAWARKQSKRWPHGYTFGKWYRDKIEQQVERELEAA